MLEVMGAELGEQNLTWKRKGTWERYAKEKQQDLMTHWLWKGSRELE